MFLLSGLLALWIGVGVGAGTEGGTKAGEAPRTLQALERTLDALTQRLGALVEQAGQDPRGGIVDRYLAQDEKAFKDRNRVRARDLIQIMVATDATDELRRKARDALLTLGARSYDPDLLVEKGQRHPRRDFCRRHVLPLLKKDDAQTRVLADELLRQLFRQAAGKELAIKLFRPRTATKVQREEAYKAWLRYLRR
ncbi:MAG: hypothetical protein ACC662_07600 [Planctomycetota bacterium]